jgi:hypothetical protein
MAEKTCIPGRPLYRRMVLLFECDGDWTPCHKNETILKEIPKGLYTGIDNRLLDNTKEDKQCSDAECYLTRWHIVVFDPKGREDWSTLAMNIVHAVGINPGEDGYGQELRLESPVKK